MRFYSDHIDYFVELHQSNNELPYLLMLHGFMGTGRAFKHIINPLKSFCNPITVDLAGHGKTKTLVGKDIFETERQVAQIQSIINRLSFENLFIYGYSMGGRLLYQLLADNPRLFTGAVVESSHCGIMDQATRDQRISIDKKWAESIRENFDEFLKKWVKLPLFSSPDISSVNEYKRILKQQNPELIARALEGFGAGVMPAVCKELQNLDLPLYLVAGEQDKKYASLTPQISEICDGSEFTIVKDAGHRVHVDQPEKLISILESFIKANYV